MKRLLITLTALVVLATAVGCSFGDTDLLEQIKEEVEAAKEEEEAEQ